MDVKIYIQIHSMRFAKIEDVLSYKHKDKKHKLFFLEFVFTNHEISKAPHILLAFNILSEFMSTYRKVHLIFFFNIRYSFSCNLE